MATLTKRHSITICGKNDPEDRDLIMKVIKSYINFMRVLLLQK